MHAAVKKMGQQQQQQHAARSAEHAVTHMGQQQQQHVAAARSSGGGGGSSSSSSTLPSPPQQHAAARGSSSNSSKATVYSRVGADPGGGAPRQSAHIAAVEPNKNSSAGVIAAQHVEAWRASGGGACDTCASTALGTRPRFNLISRACGHRRWRVPQIERRWSTGGGHTDRAFEGAVRDCAQCPRAGWRLRPRLFLCSAVGLLAAVYESRGTYRTDRVSS